MADGQTLGHNAVAPADPEARLAFLRETTDRALAGETIGIAPFDALRFVAAECAIPRRFINDHLAGFALDAEGWRPASEDDLLLYCYHVAGAVGCMMAVIMGVDPADEDTLDRAADLGLAFQLSNIARDLVEDHGVGRVYIPADWNEGAPSDRAALARHAERLGALVGHYEASARVGAARLPFRSRWAVLSAANIYGAIARKVVARGERAWDTRTVIHKPAKLVHLINALVECGDKPSHATASGCGAGRMSRMAARRSTSPPLPWMRSSTPRTIPLGGGGGVRWRDPLCAGPELLAECRRSSAARPATPSRPGATAARRASLSTRSDRFGMAAARRAGATRLLLPALLRDRRQQGFRTSPSGDQRCGVYGYPLDRATAHRRAAARAAVRRTRRSTR